MYVYYLRACVCMCVCMCVRMFVCVWIIRKLQRERIVCPCQNESSRGINKARKVSQIATYSSLSSSIDSIAYELARAYVCMYLLCACACVYASVCACFIERKHKLSQRKPNIKCLAQILLKQEI